MAHDNGKAGVITYGEDMYANENVYVGNVVAHSNSGIRGLGANSGDGIVLGSVNGGIIEQSLAYNNGWLCDAENGGPVRIWAYNANNVTIQFNESHHNRTGGQIDGGGFDLDHNTSRSIVQYNYSHDNEGAGFLLAQSPDNDASSYGPSPGARSGRHSGHEYTRTSGIGMTNCAPQPRVYANCVMISSRRFQGKIRI